MNQKATVLEILLRENVLFKKLEILERYASLVDHQEDVFVLIKIMKSDRNPMIRHEAAAQILKIDMVKPELTAKNRKSIAAALMECAANDSSVTVRHEAIEALGYIGDKAALDLLTKLMEDNNEDIKAASEIAVGVLKYRLEHDIDSSEVADKIVSEVNR